MTDRPLIVAHRGLSHEFPENTILAFEKAIELGVDGLELDLKRTRDNRLVVIHDDNLLRLTGKEGMVHELTYQELQKFDLGMNQKIPLIEKVLQLAKKRDIFLMAELKTFEIEQDTVKMVKKYSMTDRVWFGSMFYPVMMELRDIDPEVILYPSFGYLSKFDEDQIIKLVKDVQGQYLNIDYRNLSPEFIGKSHSNDLKVHAGTPDDKEILERMKKWGADVIVTNEPKKIL